MPDPKTGELRGNRNLKRLRRISQTKQDEEIKRGLELGLEAADSINDRSISLFSRGHQPAFAGINTFMKMPYCEDVRKVGDYEAAFVGVPFDTGTTYRPGTRFGPQAVRRISAIYDGYSVDGGVDLFEELDICGSYFASNFMNSRNARGLPSAARLRRAMSINSIVDRRRRRPSSMTVCISYMIALTIVLRFCDPVRRPFGLPDRPDLNRVIIGGLPLPTA